MKISEGIEALELISDNPGGPMAIYPALLWDNDKAVIIDSGNQGQEDELYKAVEAVGISFEIINAAVITHQDADHIGALSSLLEKAQNKIKVYAHTIEKPYIQGDKSFFQFSPTRFQRFIENFPEQQQKRMIELFINPPTVQVDETVEDGDELPIAGGLKVIFTPGHTLGHIALYHNLSRTLIAGDALVAMNGKLHMPIMCHDNELAIQSVKKFTAMDIHTVICYHGGVIQDEVNNQIAKLLI